MGAAQCASLIARHSPATTATKKAEPRRPGSAEFHQKRGASRANRLLRRRLERRDLGLAAQRHRTHLAVAVERHDDLGHAVTLQQRDVANFRAAERVVEEGPLSLLRIV